MADECDIAAQRQQDEIDHALAAHAVRKKPEPRWFCEDCGDLIPRERRDAVVTSRCADCQTYHEKRRA